MSAEGTRPRRAGTTLVETLIALGLLAALLISTAGLIAQAGRQVAAAANVTRALALARAALERLEGRSFRHLVGGPGCDPAEPICVVSADEPASAGWRLPDGADLPSGRVELRVEALDGPDLERAATLRVTVVVSWREGSLRRRLHLLHLRN